MIEIGDPAEPWSCTFPLSLAPLPIWNDRSNSLKHNPKFVCLENGVKMSKISVALIEDHDLTRVGIRTALQQRSEIEFLNEAVNGSQGLKLIETEQPDIAIVDIGLPDMDGIELTRKFKEAQSTNEALQQTKVLILTLYDNEDAVLAAFAAGADSYCMKNVNFDLLLEALAATHEGGVWIDPAIARIVLSHTKKPATATSQPADSQPENTVAISASEPEEEELLESYTLTERELEVLRLIVEGASNAEIAQRLFITVGTVKTHVRNILNKLCADDRTQAAVRALRSGLVGWHSNDFQKRASSGWILGS